LTTKKLKLGLPEGMMLKELNSGKSGLKMEKMYLREFRRKGGWFD